MLGVDDGGAVLARLGVEEADDRADEVVQVGCVEVCGCGAREREQVVDQTADALDLGEREVAEPGAELLVAHALGQQLDEGADRDEGVADLVRDAGGEHAERREAVGTREQLARAGEIGGHPSVLREPGGAFGEALREREVARRERGATGAGDEQEARAGARAEGNRRAPRAVAGRLAGLQALDLTGSVPGHGHQSAVGGFLDEQDGSLEMERPGQQRDERAGELGALRLPLGPLDFLHRPASFADPLVGGANLFAL